MHRNLLRAPQLSAILLTALGAPQLMLAQSPVVTGVVSDASGVRTAGALVVALDAKGQLLARALSGRDGEYSLTVPVAGPLLLHTLRVGYQASEPVALSPSASDRVKTSLVLSSQRVAISADKARQKNVCGTPHDTTSDVTKLWEEGRKAIASTRLRFGGDEISSHIMAFDRKTSRDAKTIQTESTRERDVAGSRPFSSLPPDSIAHAGYVIESETDVAYYAPDAEVLLSSAFAETHCFGVQGSNSQHADWVGMSFKPKNDRLGVKEIAGTFWFDRNSLELRRIEFRYTNVPTAFLSAAVGGDLSFARLPIGAWVISHWETRMPQGQIQSQIALQHSQARERTMVNIEALRVSGARVTRVRIGSDEIVVP